MVAGGASVIYSILEITRHEELRNVENDIQGTDIIPIAFLLIDGPGVMTSVIISQQKDELVVTIISIIIVINITYLILRSIGPIYRILENRGSEVISRIFAGILDAIPIQYIAAKV